MQPLPLADPAEPGKRSISAVLPAPAWTCEVLLHTPAPKPLHPNRCIPDPCIPDPCIPNRWTQIAASQSPAPQITAPKPLHPESLHPNHGTQTPAGSRGAGAGAGASPAAGQGCQGERGSPRAHDHVRGDSSEKPKQSQGTLPHVCFPPSFPPALKRPR